MINKNRDTGLYEVTCDFCSSGHTEVKSKSYKLAVRRIIKKGWYVFQDEKKEWNHSCPDCGLSNDRKKKHRDQPKRKGKTYQEETKVPRDYEIQHRQEALLRLIKDNPTKMLAGLAKREEAEWHFGRLYLIGGINNDQYAAASYLDKVTRDYLRMLRRYGDVHASSFEKTEGSTSPEDLSTSALKTFARAKKRYDNIYDLLEQSDEEIKAAIVDALTKDKETDLELISKGLTTISVGMLYGNRRRKK